MKKLSLGLLAIALASVLTVKASKKDPPIYHKNDGTDITAAVNAAGFSQYVNDHCFSSGTCFLVSTDGGTTFTKAAEGTFQ